MRDLLRAQIVGPGFPGSALPSETDLMREFHEGRNVIRSALAQLQRDGLVARIQGAGTFVATQKMRHAILNGGVSGSVSDPMARLQTRVVSEQIKRAPQLVAVRLGVPQNTSCLVVETVTVIDGNTLLAGTSYVADPDFQQQIQAVIENGVWRGDWYDALTLAGLPIKERELVTEAVLADELVAADLDVELGAPLLSVERKLLLADGTPCEYGFTHCRGDNFALVYNVSFATDRRDG